VLKKRKLGVVILAALITLVASVPWMLTGIWWTFPITFALIGSVVYLCWFIALLIDKEG